MVAKENIGGKNSLNPLDYSYKGFLKAYKYNQTKRTI